MSYRRRVWIEPVRKNNNWKFGWISWTFPWHPDSGNSSHISLLSDVICMFIIGSIAENNSLECKIIDWCDVAIPVFQRKWLRKFAHISSYFRIDVIFVIYLRPLEQECCKWTMLDILFTFYVSKCANFSKWMIDTRIYNIIIIIILNVLQNLYRVSVVR